VAIKAGVAVVKRVRSGLVALAGFRRNQTVRAMFETFEFDGGGGVLRQQAGKSERQNDARQKDNRFLHGCSQAL